MVDIETLALLGSAWGGANLIAKFLGPTAEYLGEGVKTWTQKRINSVSNIFSIATRKLGDKIKDEGAVPPKVLRGIINEGSYCDDFLSAEYFGGVLASSRSGIPRDDRGAYFIALISRLSTYQIRTHYILYHIVKKLFDGTSLNIGLRTERAKMQIYVPFDMHLEAMGFDEKENPSVLVPHTLFGLVKEELIDKQFACGNEELMRGYLDRATRAGVMFQPSPSGVELFLWGHGRAELQVQEFFDKANQFEIDGRVNISPGYQKVKE